MDNIGTKLSDEIAAVVGSAGQAVVRVEARARGPSSGVLWAPGVVVTADHAVEGEEGIRVGTADGRTLEATLAGRDSSIDLAVLRVQGETGAPPAWTDGESLRVGHVVLALARPGRTTRASLGIVSALGEAWRTDAGGRVDRYLQSDLALFRGFSGGLLVDSQGRGLGLCTSGVVRGAAMAIPTGTLRRSVEEILAHGAPRRGFLGVGTVPVRFADAQAAKLGQSGALLVVSVQPGSPADRAGVILGDVLLGLAGTPVKQVQDLFATLEDAPPGKPATARVLRGGEPREVAIVVGARGA